MIKKSNVLRTKALISFGASIALITMMCFISNTIFELSESTGNLLWFLLLVLVIIIVARASALGNPFFRAASFGDGWHHMDSTSPSEWKEGRKKNVYLVILTSDGCLFNGEYDVENRMFHGYDGLDFKDEEIYLWRFERDLLPFISKDRKRITF